MRERLTVPIRELEDASEWQEVRRRKVERAKKSIDVARSYQYVSKEAVRTSFFFQNFPENFRAKHMLQAFLKYGEFEEVVIQAKRDKFGKRLGFARVLM